MYGPYWLDLVRALARGARRDEAELVVKRLGWLVDEGDHPTARGDAACAFGVLHGDPDAGLAGVDHYGPVARRYDSLMAWVDAARASGERDKPQVTKLLQEAADLYETMGAHRRLDQCHAMLRELGVREVYAAPETADSRMGSADNKRTPYRPARSRGPVQPRNRPAPLCFTSRGRQSCRFGLMTGPHS